MPRLREPLESLGKPVRLKSTLKPVRCRVLAKLHWSYPGRLILGNIESYTESEAAVHLREVSETLLDRQEISSTPWPRTAAWNSAAIVCCGFIPGIRKKSTTFDCVLRALPEDHLSSKFQDSVRFHRRVWYYRKLHSCSCLHHPGAKAWLGWPSSLFCIFHHCRSRGHNGGIASFIPTATLSCSNSFRLQECNSGDRFAITN